MNKLIILSIMLAGCLLGLFIAPGFVQAQYYTGLCVTHSYQRCNANFLYWYDSCGNQQDIAQYCTNGCYNNSCQNNYNNNYNYNYNNYNNYNNYGNCTYHAYKLCVGNNIYWYDSCGNQQDLYYGCTNGQVCQYGQCTAYIQPVQPTNNYVAQYRTACSGSSIYWYDSLGVISGLYKNCADTNSCTTDACSGNKCSNTIKCDGSTCAVGSADYNSHCQASQPVNQNHCGNGLCETTLGETSVNCLADCKINTASSLSTSMFARQDANSGQWQKTVQVDSNSQVFFMISATNNSTTQIDNVNISANIPTEITSLGDLQINGVPVSGDIVAGVYIGSVAPSTTKLVTFEGRTQTISAAATKQATATSSVSGVTQSDSVSINLAPGQVAAAVSGASATSGFWGFLKRWYLWILGILVLIFLFIIVFKRFSSDV